MLVFRITQDIDPEDVLVLPTSFFANLMDKQKSFKENEQDIYKHIKAKYTTKRDINIFTKKFIFIPCAHAQHWTLTVIVNPGDVQNKESRTGRITCALEMDSRYDISTTRLPVLAKKRIIGWLNYEWKFRNPEQPVCFTTGIFWLILPGT